MGKLMPQLITEKRKYKKKNYLSKWKTFKSKGRRPRFNLHVFVE